MSTINVNEVTVGGSDDRFENKVASTGIHYSRYIASWTKEAGGLNRKNRQLFREWLNQCGLTEQEVDDVYFLAENGKLELESNVKLFLQAQGKEV